MTRLKTRVIKYTLIMLYIVGTPIGNLDDLSIRACKVLCSVDIVLTEDTRSTHILLQKAKELVGQSNTVNQKVISYYQEVEFQKLPEIIDWLKQDKEIALVSQAGMPVISDPGYLLVQTAQKYQLPITIIPGPSSVDTALVLSGMKFDYFHFVGFLPKKPNDKAKLFSNLSQVASIMHREDVVFVAFESPDRVSESLSQLYSQFPNISITLCRELTKKFEEIVIQPDAKAYKGEIVILFSFK